MTNTVQILGALFLVALNGFFVAAEFGLARARLTRLDSMAADGVGTAKLAADQARHIDRYLAACQLGITLSSLGLGWLGEPAFATVFHPVFDALGLSESLAKVFTVIMAFALITALHVIIGELAPKTLAIQRAEDTARYVSRPLEAFRIVFAPVIHVFNGAGNWIVRRLGVEPASEHDMASTPEDLQMLIAQGEEGGTIEPEEADMLEGVFSLGDTKCGEVMTPRPDVRTIPHEMPLKEALTRAIEARHSRYPVLDTEGVVGVAHLSDLVQAMFEHGEDAPAGNAASPPLFVLESHPADEVLKELQRQRTSMAVVLDEYGEMAGVVTVEDIVEEIVGEIDDERDGGQSISSAPDGRLIVRGSVPLEDLADYSVEVEDESVTSVGGLIFTRLGRLPRTGDSITIDGWTFEVEATRGTRVVLVSITEDTSPVRDAEPT